MAEEYFFLASEDYYYENPANWFPSYPGTEISEDEEVVIMSDVYINGFDLKVAGKLKVTLGVKISSVKGNLYVQEGGELDNEGEILVNQVKNQGMLINRISATFYVNDYHALTGAITNNSLNAQFITVANLVNEGTFHNYSHCKAGKTFVNRASFYQTKNSQLEIAGVIMPEGEFDALIEAPAPMAGAEARAVYPN